MLKWVALTFLWIGAALFPSICHATNLEKFSPVEIYGREKFTPENPDRPTIADIKKIRKGEKAADLDSLLEKLKLKPRYQRLFQSPALLFQSESLLKDFVSKSFPRAIFHIDGFLLAFITDESTEWAFQTLEMAEFDPATSRWRAERITFGEAPKDLKDCNSCHGTPYQPKWGSYGLWVGATGGFFDYLSTDDITRLDAWKRSENARLAWVAGLFVQGEKPNTSLATHLSALQFRSMMSELIEEGVYAAYSPLIRGLAKGCGKFENFFPAEGPNSFASHETRVGMKLESLKEKTTSHISDEYAAKLAVMRVEYKDRANFNALAENFDHQRLDDLARLRLILEGRNGKSIDLLRWGLSEKPGEGSYHFSQGDRGLLQFYQREFLPVYASPQPACDDLSEKSRNLLSPKLSK